MNLAGRLGGAAVPGVARSRIFDRIACRRPPDVGQGALLATPFLALSTMAALLTCGACQVQKSPPQAAANASISPYQKAQQIRMARQSEYVGSLLVYDGDFTPRLAVQSPSREAVEAAMGTPDHVWHGEGWGQKSKDTVYLYYLAPDSGSTAPLRDTMFNAMRKRFRFVFSSAGDTKSAALDELRIYDERGYGGRQITRHMTLERSYLLW